MRPSKKPSLERSQSERIDIEPSFPGLKSHNSLESEDSRYHHRSAQPFTFFEKQQNETLKLYNSDSLILQMAVAAKNSTSQVKHQIMNDLITLTKRPSMKEYLTSNTGLAFKSIPPFIISAPTDNMLLSNSEHSSDDQEEEHSAYEIEENFDEQANAQQDGEDSSDEWIDDGNDDDNNL